MALNFNNICRLCMEKKDALLPLFKERKGQIMSLPNKIMNFVPIIKLFSGDGLPAQVCRQCIRLVNNSYKFKKQCENSDVTLRHYLNSKNDDKKSEDILHSVFRKDNEQGWKLTIIKNEITEGNTALLEGIAPNDNSDDDDDDRRASDGEDCAQQTEWVNSKAGPSSKESNLTIKKTKKIVSRKQKKNGKKWTSCEFTKNEEIKAEDEKLDDSNTLSNRKCVKQKKSRKNWTSSNELTENNEIKVEGENLVYSQTANDDVHSQNSNELMSDMKVEPYVKLEAKTPKVKEKKSFLCHDCGKNFARKQHLLLHLRTHTGEKPFACKVCGESFGMSSNLNKHMRIHTGERPFLCTMCGKCFGRSDTLTKHMRCHTGEKPFHCNVCGNNFGRSSTLINHMRTHLGEKPYLCTECGRRFVQSYDLTKHMRSHTGEKPYCCAVCRMSFGQKNSLNKHMRSHTSEIQYAPVEFQRTIPYVHYRPTVTDLTMERNAVLIGSGSQIQ